MTFHRLISRQSVENQLKAPQLSALFSQGSHDEARVCGMIVGKRVIRESLCPQINKKEGTNL
jgi:hypothetical protein